MTAWSPVVGEPLVIHRRFLLVRSVLRLGERPLSAVVSGEDVDAGLTHVLTARVRVAHVLEAKCLLLCTTYNHSVEIEPGGRRARGEANDVSYLERRETGELDIWFGRYLDVYEKRGDE
ncbi:MAG: hypothetical protein P8L16_11665 [Ilumatobacter sp.]|nr:hypothetical protein [Ilumatobacter sp.]